MDRGGKIRKSHSVSMFRKWESRAVSKDETLALLLEINANHGDFTASVLKDMDVAVESGMELQSTQEMGWQPTPEMCAGRHDYRGEQIFTIDPTTAKDLDDALPVN
jgi:exoribonuclease R